MRIYAHRGDSANAPENTLRAFKQALALGVDGIELDVHGTVDGVPVIIHDRELGRTTNGSGPVSDLDLETVQTFDAGDGEQIPTLHEVLDLVGDRVHLDIEVKQPGIERQVLATLDRCPDVRFAISSFDWEILTTLRSLSPTVELWPLAIGVSDALLSIAKTLESDAVAIHAMSYSTSTAERLASSGLNAMIWTVNDLDVARRMRDLGAWALCSDAPGTMREL